MRRNPNIVMRRVPPATFLVDITKCYNNKKDSLLEIDEIGAALWGLIDDEVTREIVCARFLDLLTDEKSEEFIEMVTNDINEFLDTMVANGTVYEGEQE